MHTVAVTRAFERQAEEAGMSLVEVNDVIDLVARNPLSGAIMPGTGGCRKLRVAGRGKGKSGGYRVITYFAAQSMPVYLLAVFGKVEKANLTQAERNALSVVAKTILDEGSRERR